MLLKDANGVDALELRASRWAFAQNSEVKGGEIFDDFS
jgi:hypothetical protein